MTSPRGLHSPEPGANAPERTGGGVQVIARASKVLRSLGGAPDGLSLAELAASVQLPKSTVHRIVGALQAEGLTAVAGGNGRYVLGPEFIRLASGQHQGMRTQARPLLEALSRKLNEAVDLSILVGDRAVFVDHIEAPHFHPLRAVSAVGTSFPTYSTANGKALLAAQGDEQLQSRIPARLKSYTPNTVTDRAELLREITRVRKQGYAVVREEHTLGISAIGAVVRDGTGAVAAVSVPIPTPRFQGKEKQLVNALINTCRQISETLSG